MKVLDEIVKSKIDEISLMKSLKRNFRSSLLTHSRKPVFICEVKPASPSEGKMQNFNKDKLLSAYSKEACAVSVLTDNRYFGGSYSLLQEVKEKTGLPVLQKDFVLDQYQMIKGVAAGADAVLLIVRILSKSQLSTLIKFGKELAIDCVVEINDEEDLKLALDCGAEIILINNRNLDTLAIDLDTTARLAPLIPDGVLKIGASGYNSPEQIKEAEKNCHAFLIGSSFVKADDPLAKIQALKGES